MRILQVVQCFDYGDGIGNDIRAKHELYKRCGYESEIYAVHTDIRLTGMAEHVSQMHPEPGDILLLHYSGYCTMMDQIEAAKCTKVLIYHNITPPQFFEAGPVREHCRMGMDQLASLSGIFDYYAGDSQYNVDCLKSFGVTRRGDVLPIVVEFSGRKLKRAEKKPDDEKLFLFVGRIVENKKIDDIIAVFDRYHNEINKNSRLMIPGNTKTAEGYTARLKELIASLPSKDSIELMGKVSDEKLYNLFMSADMYISMSEHEGFGIPLLEAMNYRIPVLAYDTSAVGETMGDAGVLVRTKDPRTVARIMHEVLSDEDALKSIIEAQTANLARFTADAVEKRARELIDIWSGRTPQPDEPEPPKPCAYKTVQMQGPFETSYSLAIVNRRLIEAIDRAGFADASIHCMEGGGDYEPELKNLADKPRAKELWEKGKGVLFPDIGIRNMYPPTGQPTTAKYSFQSFAWEEDRLPKNIIDDFNATLDGIGTTSDFVTRALIDSGLTIPVRSIGNGVDVPDNYSEIAPYPLDTRKGTVLLHISSCFPRKGVDVLLGAYFDAFTADDDVCLVIKTFPNPHNRTEEQLAALRERHGDASPEVILLNFDMPQEQLFSLYRAADCYVHSARGEGFGLPVAEAMKLGLPVIVSNNTGLADFATEETAVTVGYTMETAHSHLSENSRWAEPDRAELTENLKAFVFDRESLGIDEKVENARRLICEKYSWDAVALRWKDFIDETVAAKKRMKVAMVTTWNTKCGIAEFTRMQTEATDREVAYEIFPDRTQELIRADEANVKKRTWRQFDANVDELIAALKESDAQIVELQYNFAFYSVVSLARIIEALYKTKPVIVHLHSAKYFDDHINKGNEKQIKRAYNKAAAFIVHQPDEIPYLVKHGVKRSLIRTAPLGQPTWPVTEKTAAQTALNITGRYPVISSYGFLLPNKGIEKTIRAVALLKRKYPNILFIASCARFWLDISKEYYDRCMAAAEELELEDNVALVYDYLEPEESLLLLGASDICTMVYDKTHESSSGAMRFCAAAMRPTITTHQNIFKEFEDCTYQIEDNSPEEIAAGVERLLDVGLQRQLTGKLRERVAELCWKNVSCEYIGIYKELINGKK